MKNSSLLIEDTKRNATDELAVKPSSLMGVS